MRGYDVLQELYYGKIRPCDRIIRDDTDIALARDAFAAQEQWFRENLTSEVLKRFDELVSCHKDILKAMSFENFRSGFQLGAMMVMEAVGKNDSELFEL